MRMGLGKSGKWEMLQRCSYQGSNERYIPVQVKVICGIGHCQMP